MNSKAYFDSNGQLVVPQVPPFQESECLNVYSSTSVLLPNDTSYDKNSAHIARQSHLNPNLVLGNMGSPILNISSNSPPSIGTSSLVTDVTYGTNFQRTTSSSINIESYQNLPSSPLPVSSRNTSGLAMENTSTPLLTESLLNHINEVARRRERPDHDMSSLFKGKERELLDDLPQMSKKPRPNADAAHIIQQLLQKREHLVFQDYNQQLKTLLQQHEFQKLKQKDVAQSQYVAAPTQKQMRLYLQQLVKSSRPLPSGICSRRLMQFMYHLQHRPSDNSITYWRKFVAEYYAPRAKKRWCLSLYDGVGERSLGVFSQLAMEAWRCDLCGSNSGKGFESNFEILPRLYKTYFESGVLDELLFLDLPHEYILPSGFILLRYEKVVQETIYEKFRVVREGQLRIIFTNDLKILGWEFCARCHDEVVPRQLIAPQVDELAQMAEKYQRKDGSSKVAVQNLQSTCKMFVDAEGQLKKNLDSVLVNDLGFPKKYIRCLQIGEIVTSMTDLMTFSLDNNIGPIESIRKYSQEGSTSNVLKKQAETPATSEAILSGSKQPHGRMSCHQKMQNPTSNPKKRKPFGSASSTLSEFDNKTQEQMIGKILQQMESNTREKATLSKNVKVEVPEVKNSGAALTADVANRGTGRVGNVPDLGNKNTFVGRSVQKNVPTGTDSSKSTSSNVRMKQEPDDDIYKDLYLSEAIMDVDRGFFRIGALNDE